MDAANKSFFTKLSKKKSASKGDKKAARVEEGEAENNNSTLQPSKSQESLHYASAQYAEVSSDSPRSRVSTHSSEHVYSSPYHENRSKIHAINDEGRRRETTLKIWIMEVKGVPCRKRYFCNLVLGNEPYRRTFSKTMSRMCFWGEFFELESIPQFCSLRVELMREWDKRPGYKKIGSVEIDLPSVSSCPTKLVDEWYAVKIESKHHERAIPTLRIKHRYQSLDILPLQRYNSLRLYLRDNAATLCDILEPLLCVKAKEDIATALVNIMQAENMAVPFLVNIILADVQRIDNEHLLLRGNSIATKAIEAYMRLIGEYYLQETLSEVIQALVAATEDLEVDPLRITNMSSLPAHREALKNWTSKIWEIIIHSCYRFPVELRRIFQAIRNHLSNQEKIEVIDKLVSACVFLRFLCPAILYPSLFNITQEYPEEGTVRNLTLVAKTLQTLANFTTFRGKENFMEFLQDFIEKEQDRCRTFLRMISSLHCDDNRETEYVAPIDIGRHCALLHLHLSEAVMHNDTQVNQNEIGQVISLAEGINSFLGNDRKRKQPIPCQISSHVATLQMANQSYLQVPSHVNNNYIDNQNDSYLESPYENDFPAPGMEMQRGATKKISYPHCASPGYDHHKNRGTKSFRYFSTDKTAATDLSTSDDYVFVDAINEHSSGSPGFLNTLMEANNNNNMIANEDWPNGNGYYMSRPDTRLHSNNVLVPQHSPLPPQRFPHSVNQGRLNPRATAYPSRSHSVSGVPSPIERRRLHHDIVNPENCGPLDSCSQQMSNLVVDGENIQGSLTSISQISNVASSGYHSFVYSQSSSPVDSLLQTDNAAYLARDNRSLTPPVVNHNVHESPLASPHRHVPSPSKRHRSTNRHPSQLRYAGTASAHGTPRRTARAPHAKEIRTNSGLGSSQSVEDLPSYRCNSNNRHRNCSSSSDESTPAESPTPPLCTKTRLQFGGATPPPRTNPLCSPRAVHSTAFKQELQARINQDRIPVTPRTGRRKGRVNNQGDFRQEDFDENNRFMRENNNPEEPQSLLQATSQQVLNYQEKQMRAIVDKLSSMEHEFRHEQTIMWEEIQRKEARIDDQAKKIAELDNANTVLTRTVAKLNNNN